MEAPPPMSAPAPAPYGHALADPAFHHRGTERSGVEVHEAFANDCRAVGKVGAQADPAGVCYPRAGRTT